MSPQKWLVIGFLVAIAAGAVLLSLPGMTTDSPLSPIDALFTATSAVCVTGLIVVDTATAFTPAGQIVILLLIQFGGIGIVTVASLLILSASDRLSLDYEAALSATVGEQRHLTPGRVTVFVITSTLLIEAVGTLALLPFWDTGGSLGQRVWECLFHAVSAFCNAGFSLFSTSLERFAGNPGACLVIMLLVVLGGFGFVNLAELAGHVRRRQLAWRHFSLVLKLGLVFTPVLILGGATLLLLVERNVAFASLEPADRVMAALFHSVSARTAGFNTVPVHQFSDVSLMFIALLMWVGGLSGSCAGGIKVTTLAVLGSMVRAHLSNFAEPSLFNRCISRTAQRKAVVLVVLSLIAIVAAFFALAVLEGRIVPHSESERDFVGQGFEVVSAIGTVGLSTGITGDLGTGSKALLMVLMFIGRLGPLAVIAAWATASKPRPFKHPEEQVPVG